MSEVIQPTVIQIGKKVAETGEVRWDQNTKMTVSSARKTDSNELAVTENITKLINDKSLLKPADITLEYRPDFGFAAKFNHVIAVKEKLKNGATQNVEYVRILNTNLKNLSFNTYTESQFNRFFNISVKNFSNVNDMIKDDHEITKTDEAQICSVEIRRNTSPAVCYDGLLLKNFNIKVPYQLYKKIGKKTFDMR